MKTYINLFSIVSLVLCLSACNDDLQPETINNDQVQILADIHYGLETRVSDDGTAFSNNDAIKVHNTGRENKNLATYTYSSSTAKWNTTDELYWYGEVENTFNAWYPADASYTSFTIPSDQSTGLNEADWMTATATACKADGAVSLAFSHHLSKVTVIVESWGNEFALNERVVNSLELNSASSVMTNNGTITGDKTSKWIKSYVAQANMSFEAVIAPDSYTSGQDIMKVYLNGSNTPLSVQTTSPFKLEEGKSYTFKLTIGKSYIILSEPISVDEWDDEELGNMEATVAFPYIDEYGINCGPGVEIDGVIWAPVNCGFHKTAYPYGKLYQWGRKYGQGYDEEYTNIYDATYPTYENGGLVLGPVSISEGLSKSNKDVYYTCEYGSQWQFWWSSDAQYSEYNFLWNSGTEENPIKSENDPCPSGWRVPTNRELENLIRNHSQWTTRNGQNGYWFSGSETYDETVAKVFFPAGGFRTMDGYGNNRRYVGTYYGSKYVSALHMDYQGTIRMSTGYPYGKSIRCVRDYSYSEYPSDVKLNLSAVGTANSYIVSKTGSYEFTPTKGNSSESVGKIASVTVLWESFGTNVTPSVGDLITNVMYEDGNISFDTPETFKEGNAVIAAKDINGTILWSWHIWLTDKPKEYVYPNNAGIMLDRNIGATSATPGEVEAIGLMYQWGRKDPFLGSSIVSDNESCIAKSTNEWPSSVISDKVNGTIEFSIKNPMHFICRNTNHTTGSNEDWLFYENYYSVDDTRWQSIKTIYDPCPLGWKLPNTNFYKTAGFHDRDYDYDKINCGMNFYYNGVSFWFPVTGQLTTLQDFIFPYGGFCWTCDQSSAKNRAYFNAFYFTTSVDYDGAFEGGYALPVRCEKE